MKIFFPRLDSLRFLAFFFVYWDHCISLLFPRFFNDNILYYLKPIRITGGLGVHMFFVISGFVMIVSSESLKKLTWGWKIFAEKRILRIVPIYWIITTYKLLILLFASALVYHAKIDAGFILKSYFFIPARIIQLSTTQPFKIKRGSKCLPTVSGLNTR